MSTAPADEKTSTPKSGGFKAVLYVGLILFLVVAGAAFFMTLAGFECPETLTRDHSSGASTQAPSAASADLSGGSPNSELNLAQTGYCILVSVGQHPLMALFGSVAGILSFLFIFLTLKDQQHEQIRNNKHLLDEFKRLQEEVTNHLNDAQSPDDAFRKLVTWIKDGDDNHMASVSKTTAIPGFWLLRDLHAMVLHGESDLVYPFSGAVFVGPKADNKSFAEHANTIFQKAKTTIATGGKAGDRQSLERFRQFLGLDESAIDLEKQKDLTPEQQKRVASQYNQLIARIIAAGGVVEQVDEASLSKVGANFILRSHKSKDGRTTLKLIYFGAEDVASEPLIFFAENEALGRMFFKLARDISAKCANILNS